MKCATNCITRKHKTTKKPGLMFYACFLSVLFFVCAFARIGGINSLNFLKSVLLRGKYAWLQEIVRETNHSFIIALQIKDHIVPIVTLINLRFCMFKKKKKKTATIVRWKKRSNGKMFILKIGLPFYWHCKIQSF